MGERREMGEHGAKGAKEQVVLGIESSCDDTCAAVVRGGVLLSSVKAGQGVHGLYGGVVPELASRAHLQGIVPVVDAALREAGVGKEALDVVAFTCGPGLMGSLLTGVSFGKGLAAALGVRMVGVNHLQAHVLAHYIRRVGEEREAPGFPFLCLLASGGNSQIIRVEDYGSMEVIGQTIDDAAGEAFDKCAKALGLGYPGGPAVDKWAARGDAGAFVFSKPVVGGYDYSFSGLKTSFLYTLRDGLRVDGGFIEKHRADLCASLQATIAEVLMVQLRRAAKDLGIREVALSGGVSANSGLRWAFRRDVGRYGWKGYVLPAAFSTDNAAMVATAGYLKYMRGEYSRMDVMPFARTRL